MVLVDLAVAAAAADMSLPVELHPLAGPGNPPKPTMTAPPAAAAAAVPVLPPPAAAGADAMSPSAPLLRSATSVPAKPKRQPVGPIEPDVRTTRQTPAVIVCRPPCLCSPADMETPPPQAGALQRLPSLAPLGLLASDTDVRAALFAADPVLWPVLRELVDAVQCEIVPVVRSRPRFPPPHDHAPDPVVRCTGGSVAVYPARHDVPVRSGGQCPRADDQLFRRVGGSGLVLCLLRGAGQHMAPHPARWPRPCRFVSRLCLC
jgi:hypothetical protein